MPDTLLLFREAFAGTLLIAAACSVLGVYVVYRQMVFVAAALAQLSSAGIALAGFLAGLGFGGIVTHELGVSSAVTLGGVMFFASETARHRLPTDSRLGLAYVLAGAGAVLLAARTAGMDVHEFMLRGNILGITGGDVWLIFAVVVLVLAVHAAFFKEFLFVSFDREMAATLGYRVAAWNLLMHLTIGAMIAVSMAAAGVLLVFAFLVVPGVTGVILGRSVKSVFVWAIVSGLVSSCSGFVLSVAMDLPTGPAIVAVSGVLAALAWITRRLQGG
ncbi:MAG: metal ABC transporter permease [Gemmatimonadetes bacterium]|nr:metal ABC transporter permease [Gemmatimonadota bacterium]